MDATTNGAGSALKEELEKTLTAEPLTLGYKPTLPMWAMYTDASYLPQIYILRDIELMLTHPKVMSALDYYKGGLSVAETETTANSPEIQSFVEQHVERFWELGVTQIQGGYEYGWIGLEPTYRESQNYLIWDSLIQFSPRDVFLLTQDFAPIGVRVKNVPNKGNVDLWMGTEDVPAKGLWYAHRPRHNRYYGQSQLLGAWRPWRRLAWKDGAETVTDTGCYRFAFCGPLIRYPEEDLQIATNTPATPPGTTLDSQGRPRRYARDIARFIAEQFKAGAGIGLPSTNYPPEQGGGSKWDAEFPTSALDVQGLIAYVKYLEDQISYGIGVSPELLQAAETGTGYSGRKLPMEAFLMQQQRIANAILSLFVEQILRPLVRWNFGTQAVFQAKVKNILKGQRQDASGAATADQDPDMRPDQVPGPVPPKKGAPIQVQGQQQGQVPLSLVESIDRIKSIAEKIRRSAA